MLVWAGARACFAEMLRSSLVISPERRPVRVSASQRYASRFELSRAWRYLRERGRIPHLPNMAGTGSPTFLIWQVVLQLDDPSMVYGIELGIEPLVIPPS